MINNGHVRPPDPTSHKSPKPCNGRVYYIKKNDNGEMDEDGMRMNNGTLVDPINHETVQCNNHGDGRLTSSGSFDMHASVKFSGNLNDAQKQKQKPVDILLNKTQGNFTISCHFTAKSSGVTALFGHSGAGKTSIINMVAGLSRPDSGYIRINGHTVFDSKKNIDMPPEKRRFGYVFQDGRLFPHLSVHNNLLYGMKRVKPDDRFVPFDPVVALLGIGHLLKRHPATLSGGEKQRVAIGRALLTSPILMLMDEPLASLDASRKSEVLPFISKLSKEFSVPILYVTHSFKEIMALADTLVFLSNGSPVAVGPLEEVIQREDFQRLIAPISSELTLKGLQ